MAAIVLNRVSLSLIVTGLGLPVFSSYADVDFEASIASELIYQNIDSNTLGSNDVYSLQVKPVVGATVETDSVDAFWIGSVTHLQREGETAPNSDTFPEYEYNLQWQPIENVLTFSGSGNLKYRNVNAADFLVADYLNSSDELAKAQSDRVGARLTLLRGDWIRAIGNVNYSVVDADESTVFSDFAMDSENYSGRAQIFNGDEAKRIKWDFRGSYRKSERSSRALSDFVSRDAKGYIDTLVFRNIGIRLTGYHEENQVSENRAALSNNDEFTSYGAGLVYRQSNKRYLAVTVNEAQSDDPELDGEQFVGFDLKWAFSPRTSLKAEVGKNAYGSRADVDFEYQTKYTSAALSYHDRVTNTSRLLTEFDPIGIFICPVDVATLTGCTSSTDIGYIPETGEQVVPVLDEIISLEEEIILRESLIGHVTYDKGKLSLQLALQYAEDQLLEQERTRETSAISVESTYRLNNRMNFLNSINYAIVKQQSPTLQNGETNNLSIRTGIDRYLNPRLIFQSYLSFLNKDGNYSGGRYGSDYQDIRLSVGVRYIFD